MSELFSSHERSLTKENLTAQHRTGKRCRSPLVRSPQRVIRADLAGRQSLPVFRDQRTCQSPTACLKGADTVEKVENSTSAKNSLKSARGELRQETPSRNS